MIEKIQQQEINKDAVWGEFMGKQRDWREVAKLIGDKKINPDFQEKAIEILLAPDIKKLPFTVNLEFNSYSSLKNEWIGKITNKQADFIAQKIPLYIEEIKQKDINSNIDNNRALKDYNNLIPKLLPKLPDEKAEKLFELFSINDQAGYELGYGPLEDLLRNSDVDDKWKIKAVEQIHSIIVNEENNENKPKKDYERLIGSYADILNRIVFRTYELPVNKQFYQREIEFILKTTNEPFINSYNISNVLRILTDKELKHRLVRQHVLTNSDSPKHFGIYDPCSLQAAKKIIKQFPEDIKMKTCLESKIKDYQIREKERVEKEKTEKTKEKSILSKMRVNL